jgi:hypothetical protein
MWLIVSGNFRDDDGCEPARRARAISELFNDCRLICLVQSRSKKHFALFRNQIICVLPVIPRPMRGAFRDRHGRWVRDAMDVMASSRVSDAWTNGAVADGEVVWS